MTIMDLVQSCFDAYLQRNRGALESLLADDFTFTSQYDDHIDKKTYFEKCWPGSESMREFRTMKLVADGDEALIIYEAVFGENNAVRNVELFRASGGKIRSIEVFFGRPGKE